MKTVNAIEMVMNAGVTTSEEIFNFVMDKSNGITVPMLDEALESMMVAFKKKDRKEVKADFFARALEMEIEESAADETSVAEDNTKEEIEDMKNQFANQEQVQDDAIVCEGCKEEATGEMHFTDYGVLCHSCYEDQSSSVISNEARDDLKRLQQKMKSDKKSKSESEEELKKELMSSLTPAKATRLSKEQLTKNAKALEKYDLKGEVDFNKAQVKADPTDALIEERLEQVRRWEARVGEHGVKILAIAPIENDTFGRIGYVDIQIPSGYAELKIWIDGENGRKGHWEWYDAADFNMNQFKKRMPFAQPFAPAGMTRNLEHGSGILRLAIREDKNNQVYVRLPMDSKDGQFFDIFRTQDIRQYRAFSSNNGNFDAAVSAMVQLFWNEFKYENPANRNGFSESCLKCRYHVTFNNRDGVTEEDRKSTNIFNNSDGEAQMDNRQYEERHYCMAFKEFLDVALNKELNEDASRDKELSVATTYVEVTDKDGNTKLVAEHELDYDRKDEVTLGGRRMKRNDAFDEVNKDTVSNCVHYHGREFKSQTRIAREKLENSGGYVSPLWETKARIGRQVIQSEVKGKGWMVGVPSDFEEEVTNVRVFGIGLNVYVTDEIFEAMDKTFVPQMDEVDHEEIEFMKQVNRIYFAAFNRDELTQEQFDVVCEMAAEMPEGLSDRHVQRWEKACYWLEQSLVWAEEREEAANRPDFTTKFFAGLESYIADKGQHPSSDVKEIHIDEVAKEVIYRISEGGMDFDADGDFTSLEFIRHLDDVVYDAIQDAMLFGDDYIVVGQAGELYEHEVGVEIELQLGRITKEIVAGALQKLLDSTVKRMTYGVSRANDRVEAFLNLNASEEVLEYVAVHNGLIEE